MHILFDSDISAHVDIVPKYEAQAVLGAEQPPAAYPVQKHPFKN